MSKKPATKVDSSLWRQINLFRNQMLDDVLTEIGEKYNISAEELLKKAVRRFKRDYFPALANDEALFFQEYDRFLINDKPPFPKEWMKRDKRLWSVIGNSKSHFIPVINHLCETAFKYKESRELSTKFDIGPNNVLVKPDYEVLTKKLGVSESTVRAYVAAFIKFGIIGEVGQDSHHIMIYSIGRFIKWEGNKHRLVLFITKGMMKELRAFTIRKNDAHNKAENRTRVSENIPTKSSQITDQRQATINTNKKQLMDLPKGYNPQIDEVINYFIHSVKTHRGIIPVIAKGKARGVIKSLLRQIDDADELKACIDFYATDNSNNTKFERANINITMWLSENSFNKFRASRTSKYADIDARAIRC